MKRNFLKSFAATLTAATIAMTAIPAKPVQAQQAICMGQLMVFGGNFCPRGFANADGQLLAISQYSALFSIFGTMYGGDGRTTFGLPDLRGRSVVHVGAGPGLPPTTAQGQKLGTASFTLNQSQMPSHNHGVQAALAPADNQNPQGDLLAGGLFYHNDSSANKGLMAGDMITNSGNNLAVDKRSPMQVIRYCVALEGVYCSRN